MKIKAIIEEYNGGKYGRPGEYIAVVEPAFFKNGKIKKTGFNVIQLIEITKSGYGYGNATHAERIKTVLEYID
jgi:hypothetical protein